jgi:hypothetical protein
LEIGVSASGIYAVTAQGADAASGIHAHSAHAVAVATGGPYALSAGVVAVSSQGIYANSARDAEAATCAHASAAEAVDAVATDARNSTTASSAVAHNTYAGCGGVGRLDNAAHT